MTPSYGLRTQTPPEGLTVIGEAVRRVAPERAEFLIEIATSAASAAQALRDNSARTSQLTEGLSPLGIQRADIQSISLNVYNVYSPILPQTHALQGFGAMPQIGPAGFPAFGPAAGLVQQDVQFGAYQARNMLRVTVRDAARAGDAVDASAKAGAAILGGFSFCVADEAGARRAALEAAVRDAQSKADGLAAASGKKVSEAVAITEDFVLSNGTFAALRSAVPFVFGAGAPTAAGELEYYARVTANFRYQ